MTSLVDQVVAVADALETSGLLDRRTVRAIAAKSDTRD